MTATRLPLAGAFIASVLLHLLPLLPQLLATTPTARARASTMPLSARLQIQAQPQLLLDPQNVTPSTPQTPPPPQSINKPQPRKASNPWQQAIRQQLQSQQSAGLLYSREAIAQKLQGEAVIFFILDGGGNINAARIEESSGHPILDRDALAAIRRLRGLPADTPREVLLPVEFKLHNK